MTRLIAIVVGLLSMMAGAVWVYAQIQEYWQLQDNIEALERRGEIDAEVGKRDDYRLCLDLGGVPDKCNELRRLDPPAGSN